MRIHFEQIDAAIRLFTKYSSYFQIATSTNGSFFKHNKNAQSSFLIVILFQDIRNAFKNKKIASLLGLESGHGIDSSLALLRMFYDLGVRYMTLTHNCNVPWATNSFIDQQPNAAQYGGLTQFGRKVIQEMNRLGMMVDLAHTSYQTQLDALNETKAPLIISHSSIYTLCNSTRNVRDDVLLKLVAF